MTKIKSPQIPPPGPGTHATQRGFSLVELMVVVVILGTLAAISAPSIIRSIERNNARDEARAIANVFQRARSIATSTGQPIYATIDSASNTITLTRPHAEQVTSCTMSSEPDPPDPDPDPPDPDDDPPAASSDPTVMEYVIGSRYPNAETGNNLGDAVLCFSPSGRLLKQGTNQPFVATTPTGCSGRNLMIWLHQPGSDASNTTGCPTTAEAIGTQKDAREMINFFMIHVPYTGNAEVLQ